jgi:hypothetical protein
VDVKLGPSHQEKNRVLERISGYIREGKHKRLGKMKNDEHHNLYSSQNIMKAIKSWRTRWA